ncbi:MAG: NADH-quinone oxidoreductase subunit J [Isosphaeraceae bacterium]|nr:NADH-quinone oxidoreductase subunit J [Isosphaeraceae bacterium]
MNPLRDLILAAAVVVLGSSGTYLLLPHRHGMVKPRSAHVAGGLLAALALLLFASFWRAPSSALAGLFFYAFSLAAVAGGLLTITSKNPIYSALWFASVVLSTSGLFMLAGAQFLAAGTVIVYAGAIIVTFLFVIMLAQMEGRAPYDRAARAPGRATFSCYVLLWGLMYALLVVRATPPHPPGVTAGVDEARLPRLESLAKDYNIDQRQPLTEVLRRSTRDSLRMRYDAERFKPHVAGLGESLYTDHLITVELAGTLLFVALIGALAIASPKTPVRPGDRRPQPLTNA